MCSINYSGWFNSLLIFRNTRMSRLQTKGSLNKTPCVEVSTRAGKRHFFFFFSSRFYDLIICSGFQMGKCDCQLRIWKRVPFIKHTHTTQAPYFMLYQSCCRLAEIYRLVSQQREFAAGLMPLSLVVNQFHACGHIFTQLTGSNGCYFVVTVGKAGITPKALGASSVNCVESQYFLGERHFFFFNLCLFLTLLGLQCCAVFLRLQRAGAPL